MMATHKNPQQLPINEHRHRILAALSQSQVVVVESPTGSGKTTQIPQILFEAGYAARGMIGVTQPRRIAAVSVAQFIANQLDTTIPTTVGYKMRFEDLTDSTTRIKIMTDGILLQELKADYQLLSYGVIMVDEAHERSLNIDFILGLLKRIIEQRPEFRVVISSATINAETFSEYFDECPVVRIEATSYPVKLVYDPPQPENNRDALMDKIVSVARRIIDGAGQGDVLVFLPGERDIKECISRLRAASHGCQVELLPLYSRLSPAEQERVFEVYPGKRKIVVATNIAETSLTIEGIGWVIDSGRAKMNFYDPRTYTASLVEIPISKASCNQRRGRAGRTRPGTCCRLYTRKDYSMRRLFTREEIYRTDLSEVVLRMTEIGILDYEEFDFVAPPGRDKIRSAIETLILLDAIDTERNLTSIGRLMVNFPILPRHARMMIEALLHYPEVVEETLIAASFLSASSPFLLPQGQELEARKAHHQFSEPMGDFVSYLKLYRAFEHEQAQERFCTEYFLDSRAMREIQNVKIQLEQIVADLGYSAQSGGSVADYLSAVATGLLQFVCTRQRHGVYRSLTAEHIHIHPGSVMYNRNPRYIVAGEIVRTSRTYARSVSPLEARWVAAVSPLATAMVKGQSPTTKPLGSKSRTKSRRKTVRDFTQRIEIAGEVFSVKTGRKGRKVVVLPWEKARTLANIKPAKLPNIKKLRGTIQYGQYQIMREVNLSVILGVVNKINPEDGVIKSWPGHVDLADAGSLVHFLSKLLHLCTRKNSERELGFLALEVRGPGSYGFTCFRSYQTAVSTSLAALETLADDATSSLGVRELATVNQIYRHLQELL